MAPRTALRAPVAVGEHAGALERRFVGGGVGQLDRRGMEEAMPAGGAPGGEPGRLHRQDGVVPEGDEPGDRPDEGGVDVAPAHLARRGQRRDQAAQPGREHVGAVLAADAAAGDDVPPLVGLLHLERLGRDAGARGEADRRLGGTALRVEGGGRGGPAAHLGAALGRGGHVLDEDGEAARGREGAHGAVRQPDLGQQALDRRAQGGAAAPDVPGRQLLGSDLEQQPRHQAAASAAGACSAT